MSITISPITGIPVIRPGDDLATHLLSAMDRSRLHLADADILVICQKVVSKAEGRIARIADITASPFAEQIAAQTTDKDPRIVEIILRETTRIVKMNRGHLIVETGPGWVCANAGVDESNSLEDGTVILLPADPDASARRLKDAVRARTDKDVAVLITDTWGRPWRDGLVDFAIGIAGIDAMLDLRGETDMNGRELHHTVMAQADALAATAGLMMRKGAGLPAVLVRGYAFKPAKGSAAPLIRPRELDLFR
ncbi:MAG: coenzyme F420-0:L-glutamate ligase [Deltaproteobacteria bacterium]|nr:coenzyme F420-0:L-glutamate ligase [Deltaproteobacteria bacterium]